MIRPFVRQSTDLSDSKYQNNSLIHFHSFGSKHCKMEKQRLFAVQFGIFCSGLWRAKDAFGESQEEAKVKSIIVRAEFPRGKQNRLGPRQRRASAEAVAEHAHGGQSARAPTLGTVGRGRRSRPVAMLAKCSQSAN